MAYTRRKVIDGETVMTAELYNNLQDGIDATLKSIDDIMKGGYIGNSDIDISITNTSGWVSKVVAQNSKCPIFFNWKSLEKLVPTGSGFLTVTVNEVVKVNRDIPQGDNTIDVADFLGAGSNKVTITVTDIYGNHRSLIFSISMVTVSISSAFDNTVQFTGDIPFVYTPVGVISKTVHIVLDGKEISTIVTSVSGRQLSYTIPKQPHGAHSLLVYFDTEIDGNYVVSNMLYYELCCIEESNTDIVITSDFNRDELTQYETVAINWRVYNPTSLTTPVVLYVNGEEVSRQTVDRTTQVWSFRPDMPKDVILKIVSGEFEKVFDIDVRETSIDVEAEAGFLSLYLSSHGRSNNEENPDMWSYGDIDAVFSGFNYVSDGWKADDDNITALRVAGDARVEIPYAIFGSDFRTTGKTIEIEFATRDVMDYESIIMSCFNNGRGIQITPQSVTINSEQSNMRVQYKENESVRISFVIEKKSENRLIYCYINGILSGVVQYPENDDFSQGEPVGISIGSNDCTIDIYCIRIYDNNLTRYQILDNWIADTRDMTKLLERYTRNNIYDEYGQIVISKLPDKLPYMVLEAPSLPQYKGDKKTVSGYYIDPVNASKSFKFTDAQIDVQGTSSQYYARKNYKTKYKNGFINADNGMTEETYKMHDNSIPVNTFTYKADVASCEGANNVELVRLYDDICPYKTPPQLDNPNVRQGIDGFPMVIFWNNGKETKFLGKYNFNNDKGTEEVFGFKNGDESWEIRNNTSARSMFKSADFDGTAWQEDFEGRYPDGNTDAVNLADLARWLVSTDQTQATGNALDNEVTYDGITYFNDTAEYRLAKFKAEVEDWMELDSILFSYLFTELFLLVDSRAKNNFPTRFAYNGKWCVLPYDMDTAMGTNNEGLLAFDYNLEDIDTVNGANVYNGQDSVLYINTRGAFQDKLEQMYGKLRSDDLLSYDIVDKRFTDHQSLWCEAIFNEDAHFKYIDPLVEDGEATYLSMCQGSKESQRRMWLFNRFRYIDSKYTTGDALTKTITIRAYQKSDFDIIPYADIYPCVAFDSTRVKARGKRNEATAIISPEHWDPNGSDAVVTVYSADQLKDVGDLAPFKVGYADFSKATKIQRIKVGDASLDYNNPNMTEFYVGNNKLLKHVDFRNCSNLGGNVDLSGCSNIEEAYFDGTIITGVTLPNGGTLKKLHLPGTITNLTLLNQRALTELVIPSYTNITTLRLENIGDIVDSLAILKAIPANSRVRLIGVEWEAESAKEIINLLSTMRGLGESGNNLDKVQISGTCHIESLHVSELKRLNTLYPSLTITYAELDTTMIARQLIERTLTGTYENDRIKTLNYAFTQLSNGLVGLSLPNVETIPNGSFTSTYLTYLNLPKVKSLSKAYMLQGLHKLTTLTLPSVESIGDRVLYGNNLLEVLDLPVVKSVGKDFCKQCPALTKLILRSETVCTASNSYLLYDSAIANGTGYIYVPKALIEDYKVATYWSTYANQFRALEDYTVDGTTTGELDESKI